MIGSRSANDPIRSMGALQVSSSSRPSVICWMRGSSSSMWRRVNAAATRRRRRVWSGGFRLSMWLLTAP